MLAVILAGCGDDGPERFGERRLADARRERCGSADAETHGAGAPAPATRPGVPQIRLVEVHTFYEPVDLVVWPGQPEGIVVLEKAGYVHAIGPDGTVTVVGDLSSRIETAYWVFTGAQGLEFSPDGRLAYVHYVDRDDRSIIAEFPVGADGIIDTGAERRLLQIQQPEDSAHYGGDLGFGPDGALYIALGDGDSGTTENGGDPKRQANNPFTLFGSMLRIDPEPGPEAPYTVPTENPFADGELGAPEVWAWGLRNPWKFAFDAHTGDLWIADVGFDNLEEVSLVRRGDAPAPGRCANFGWSEFEGDLPLHADAQGPGHLVFPVETYSHDEGCAIGGGVAYRGSELPELAGWFLYGDLCAGAVWAYDPASDTSHVLAAGLHSVVAVRQGPNNELFVLEHSGVVSRVVRAP